jgi:hypothetical protein
MWLKMIKANLVYKTWREVGEVCEVHDERAKLMIAAGDAVWAPEPSKPAKASKPVAGVVEFREVPGLDVAAEAAKGKKGKGGGK